MQNETVAAKQRHIDGAVLGAAEAFDAAYGGGGHEATASEKALLTALSSLSRRDTEALFMEMEGNIALVFSKPTEDTAVDIFGAFVRLVFGTSSDVGVYTQQPAYLLAMELVANEARG